MKENLPDQIIGEILDAIINDKDADDKRESLKNKLINNGLNGKLAEPEYYYKQVAGLDRCDAAEVWERVSGRFNSRRSLRFIIGKYIALAAVVAGVVILIVTGVKIDDPYDEGKDSRLIARKQTHMKAILNMGDGNLINLQDTSASLRAGATLLRKGLLAYVDRPSEEPVTEHTLSVPRGGEYTLMLPDGTTVILNADSKLTYPNRFTGTERHVELTGEAYFNVAKDSLKPFIVRANNISIRVLGTSFNVKAYEGESIQTTLIEGSVLITTDSEHIMINPGDQLVIKNDTLSIRRIDVKTVYQGTRENRFIFDDEPLADVLKKLERWYDMEFLVSEESLYRIRFTGNLPKYQNLSKVLHMLELTTCVRFDMIGNVMMVERDL